MKNNLPPHFNDLFMEEAIELAEIAFIKNEVPVGAVIVERSSGKILAKAYNLVEEYNDPLLHAELIVIKKACKKLNSKNLSNCDIYITLEPCTMCASAISHARIDRVFYGTSDVKHGAVENGVRFFTSSACFFRPEIYSGLKEEYSAKLIKNFFIKVRKEKN